VPGLEQKRARVHRIFANVMQPAQALEPVPGSVPFNLSLGKPLADYPLVNDALLLLRLASGYLPFTAASRLLRSPFLAHADTETGVRARLDASLRRRSGPMISLGALTRLSAHPRAPQAPQWKAILERFGRLRRQRLRERRARRNGRTPSRKC
jgi:exodeoxyribonuclease-5